MPKVSVTGVTAAVSNFLAIVSPLGTLFFSSLWVCTLVQCTVCTICASTTVHWCSAHSLCVCTLCTVHGTICLLYLCQASLSFSIVHIMFITDTHSTKNIFEDII